MRFECALFILVVVGMACAVIAALSSLFWPRDLNPFPHQNQNPKSKPKLQINLRKTINNIELARRADLPRLCQFPQRSFNELGGGSCSVGVSFPVVAGDFLVQALARGLKLYRSLPGIS